MRRGTLAALAVAAVLVLLATLAIAGAVVWGLSHESVRLVIDGQPVELPPLGWPEGLAAGGAALVVGLLLAAVLPMALLLGLGLPLVVVALVCAALLGAVGLALAGLLLVLLGPVLLIAWGVRRRRRSRRPPGTATIGP